MGKASQALRSVLETYGITQNKLAVVMGISRANVGRWFHGLDPSAENIVEITNALSQLNPNAAKEFAQLYLGKVLNTEKNSSETQTPNLVDKSNAKKAGQALRLTLETHNIAQNELATVMNIERSMVYRWVHSHTDPTGDSIAAITEALQQLNPEAAREFVQLYLGDILNVGRATQTLRQVLKTYEISHDNLATTMGISRVKVDRWFMASIPRLKRLPQ